MTKTTFMEIKYLIKSIRKNVIMRIVITLFAPKVWQHTCRKECFTILMVTLFNLGNYIIDDNIWL